LPLFAWFGGSERGAAHLEQPVDQRDRQRGCDAVQRAEDLAPHPPN